MSEINLSESEIETIVKEVLAQSNESKSKQTNTLSASEAANLWNQYMGDSAAICFNTYFLHMTDDEQIKAIYDHAIQLSKNHIKQTEEYFKQANFPIPKAFSLEEDVNMDAPRVTSDNFLVYYLEVMSIYGVTTYSLSVSACGREDIRNYFIKCSTEASELLNMVIGLSKKRGQYMDSPILQPPDHVEVVQKKGFIEDLLGNPKPLTATEITNLWFNLKKSILKRTSAIGFSQVARSEEVRKLCADIAAKAGVHIKEMSELMHKDDMPAPRTWDSDVTTSTISPFSDKLMMFHMGFKLSAAIAYYGSGIATSMRADVIASYSKIVMDVIKEANTWLELMIKNGWLEKQPEAADRKALAQR